MTAERTYRQVIDAEAIAESNVALVHNSMPGSSGVVEKSPAWGVECGNTSRSMAAPSVQSPDRISCAGSKRKESLCLRKIHGL